MPSSITHELIAEETLNRLPQHIRDVVDQAPDYYFLGAQGADVLFFYKPTSRKELNIGKFLHRNRVFELFSLFSKCAALPEIERTRTLAYALGYITHYSADSEFHPFVYAYLQKTGANKLVHQQIENDWDVYFLRTRRGKEAEKYRLRFSLKKIAKEGTFYRLVAAIADEFGRRKISEAALKRALSLFGLYYRSMHGRCYRSQRGWARFEALFHYKGLSYLYPRKDPAPDVLFGEEFPALAGGRADTADELFDRTTQIAARRILLFLRAFEEGSPLPREEFSKHLLTGENID